MLSSRTISQLFALFAALTVAVSLTFAAALPVNTVRDVWDPKVLTPNAIVGWVIGTQANVTWDTSDAPQNISNRALVTLAKGGAIFSSGPGSIGERPLAEDFNLRTGFVEVTVPDVEPDNDYQVVLFGDSGNFGPVFTISEAS